MMHSPAQDAVLRVHSRISESSMDKSSAVTARLLVPSQHIGCLLGKGGSIIAEMRKITGAGIRIFGNEQIPRCAQRNDELVQVFDVIVINHSILCSCACYEFSVISSMFYVRRSGLLSLHVHSKFSSFCI